MVFVLSKSIPTPFTPVDLRIFKNYVDFYGYSQGNAGTLPDSTAINPATGDSYSRRVDSSNTTTFVIPAGVTKMRITCIGAGGGGGSRYGASHRGGSGGGGGGFASGQFNVTPGQTLTLTLGRGGAGSTNFDVYGGNGGTTSVSGTEISVSATGGTGGYFGLTVGNGGSGFVSGANLISGTSITANGGNGGAGFPDSYGWEDSPHGYGAGGGGAAGSFLGNGGKGGDGQNGGWTYTSGGGGGIGGKGGNGFGSDSKNDYYSWAGGGGGSGLAGSNGASNVEYGPGNGGKGIFTNYAQFAHLMNPITSGIYGTASRSHWGSPFLWEIISGARFVDTSVIDTQTSQYVVSSMRRPSNLFYGVNAFNGILGLLIGGGGAGAPVYDYTYGWSHHSGGDGGSGAGGGGAGGYKTNWSSGSRTLHIYSDFDTNSLSWIIVPKYRTNSGWFLNGFGGNGGALGGGGGSATGATGGFGGIGGGGGGGAGYRGDTTYPGYGGDGGVGYILLEW